MYEFMFEQHYGVKGSDGGDGGDGSKDQVSAPTHVKSTDSMMLSSMSSPVLHPKYALSPPPKALPSVQQPHPTIRLLPPKIFLPSTHSPQQQPAAAPLHRDNGIVCDKIVRNLHASDPTIQLFVPAGCFVMLHAVRGLGRLVVDCIDPSDHVYKLRNAVVYDR